MRGGIRNTIKMMLECRPIRKMPKRIDLGCLEKEGMWSHGITEGRKRRQQQAEQKVNNGFK